MVETCCPLILVTTLLQVVKHSTTLSVVTGLVVVWVSLTTDTLFLDCDTTEMLRWIYSMVGDFITGVTEGGDGKTVEGTPVVWFKHCTLECNYTVQLSLYFHMYMYTLPTCLICVKLQNSPYTCTLACNS